ncbi:hypothetical protein HK104_000125 [Borealophlyctis nickersoniae]|nr:hypothetical protein HK104_000125 [Borealophlyctis nickersoniae]
MSADGSPGYYVPSSMMNQTRRGRSQSEARLKKLIEYNMRLREALDLNRIRVSDASRSLVQYVQSTRDPLVPSVWGPLDKREDPFAPQSSGCGDGCTLL